MEQLICLCTERDTASACVMFTIDAQYCVSAREMHSFLFRAMSSFHSRYGFSMRGFAGIAASCFVVKSVFLKFRARSYYRVFHTEYFIKLCTKDDFI